jgi:hypothetical protein
MSFSELPNSNYNLEYDYKFAIAASSKPLTAVQKKPSTTIAAPAGLGSMALANSLGVLESRRFRANFILYNLLTGYR